MSTSKNRTNLRDTFAAAAIAAVLALVLSPSDPAMSSMPVHPAWLVALVLAARWGSLGLYGIPAVIVGVQAAVFASGHGELSMLARFTRPGELVALIAIGLVGVIGAIHESRSTSLSKRLRAAE